MTYTIKNLKTFKGMEGMGGFNLSLYRDGKKIGMVINDDCGGCHMYQIPDEYEMVALTAHAQDATKAKFEPTDTFINSLVDAFEEKKWLKRQCKNKTLFSLKGDPKNSYMTVKAPYSERIKTFIIEKYGDKVQTIVNETINA